VRSLVPCLCAAMLACEGPGTLYSPEGTETLRTALFRVGVRGGGPELVVLLSNGEIGCGLPAYPDTAAQAEAIEGLLAAACREGAQHVALHIYDRSGEWSGDFPGRSNATFADLTDEQPRLSSGAFYTVQEAFLIEIDGLGRGYAASDDLYIPDMGDGGNVQLSLAGADAAEGAVGADRLRGWFDFPQDEVSGEFVAQRCTGDTSLIDVVTSETDHFCQ
jgi:hypothetical protein